MSVNFTATGAMLNGVRIAGGQHSDASISTRMIRVVRSGTASGRAKQIASASGSSSMTIRRFPI
jgi:hypothetical protein